MIDVVVINHSTVLTDAGVQAAVPDFNTQVQRDLYPAWGVNASVRYLPKNLPVPANSWQVVIFDDSDQAGALGYHDVSPTFKPIAKIFARTDAQYQLSWTVTTSHEILEMLVDPDCVRADQVANSTFAALEVCDPCEGDQFGYKIGNTVVSDFIMPSYFQPRATKPFDQAGHMTRPLTLLPGGYISLWTPTKGWTQKSAEAAPGHVSRAVRATRMAARTAVETHVSTYEPVTEISVLDLIA